MSKVELNLLPDIKMKNVKNERSKRLIMSAAVLVSAASIGIFLILMLTVYGVQKKQLSDSDKSFKTTKSDIDKISDLNKILTVQNQLKSLVPLHQQKHISSRLFTYLPEVTPTNVHINKLAVDYTANTIVIDGTADSHTAVNTFADTLKFTTYKVSDDGKELSAFPSVVETNFAITTSGTTFTLTVTFDPQLFSNALVDSNGKTQTPTLKVPSLTTTRSVLNDPGNLLFNGEAPSGEQ